MAPYEVLTDVLSDLESGKVRLRAAQDKLVEAGLAYSPGYQEIGEFISAALRNTKVATEITLRRCEELE
jgi:hypothetical protein